SIGLLFFERSLYARTVPDVSGRQPGRSSDIVLALDFSRRSQITANRGSIDVPAPTTTREVPGIAFAPPSQVLSTSIGALAWLLTARLPLEQYWPYASYCLFLPRLARQSSPR